MNQNSSIQKPETEALTSGKISDEEMLDSHRLRRAVELAIKDRRFQLKTEEETLTSFKAGQYGNKEIEWKTCVQLTRQDIQRLEEIRTELQVIDNLMIRTQQFYKKLGGSVKVEIRRSDIPDKIERSFSS